MAHLVEGKTGDRRVISLSLTPEESLCCVHEQNTLSAA